MKVLILSHNPLTTYHNMGKTLLNLFSRYDSDELCQFYIYPTLPDIDRCHSYFRMTDKDVLRSYLRFSRVKGQVIDKSLIRPDNRLHENDSDASVYHTESSFKRWMRDVMWRCSRWYSRELRDWVKEEAPDVVFIAPGDAAFFYDIGLRIARDFSLPIITYNCDEFYFMTEVRGFFKRLHLRGLKKRVEALMTASAGIVAICEEIAEPYRERFGTDTIVIMTGSGRALGEAHLAEHPHILQFMGDVRRDRARSLAQIGEALDEINRTEGERYELRVYTHEQNPELLRILDKSDSVRLMGFVSGGSYREAFGQADIFVHVEAFDKQSIDKVKHSVSTKIAEVIASGTPLIAYAPDGIASTAHLKRNGCAVCITDERKLIPKLREALTDREGLLRCAENGIRTAAQYHDTEKNSAKLAAFIGSKIG